MIYIHKKEMKLMSNETEALRKLIDGKMEAVNRAMAVGIADTSAERHNGIVRERPPSNPPFLYEEYESEKALRGRVMEEVAHYFAIVQQNATLRQDENDNALPEFEPNDIDVKMMYTLAGAIVDAVLKFKEGAIKP